MIGKIKEMGWFLLLVWYQNKYRGEASEQESNETTDGWIIAEALIKIHWPHSDIQLKTQSFVVCMNFSSKCGN